MPFSGTGAEAALPLALRGLNPCFTGCPFQGHGRCTCEAIEPVLILVLLDALFRVLHSCLLKLGTGLS